MGKSSILYITAFLAFGYSGYSQTTLLSLEECLEKVQENNQSISRQEWIRKSAEEQQRVAWSGVLPQLKAFGTLDDYISLPVQLVPAEFVGGQAGEFARIQFGTQYTMTYGAEASLALVNTSAWKGIQSARLNAESAYWQRVDAELNIMEQAANAYYMALLSKSSMQLNADLMSSNDSLLQIAQVRLDNGAIEPLEFNRIKTLHLESSQRWRESSNSYSQQLARLKVLCGLAQKDSLSLLEQIDPQHAGTVTLQASATGTPRHKMLALQSEQRHTELKRQQLRVAPELSLFARYTRQAQRNEFNFFSQQGDWFDIALIGVRADWNLFTGFNRQASIRQASYQARAAELDLADADLRKEQELENLLQNYKTAAAGLRTYATHYQLTKENYALATFKYREGVYTLDQFITIYQEMVRSQNQFLIQLANYMISGATIELENQYQQK